MILDVDGPIIAATV